MRKNILFSLLIIPVFLFAKLTTSEKELKEFGYNKILPLNSSLGLKVLTLAPFQDYPEETEFGDKTRKFSNHKGFGLNLTFPLLTFFGVLESSFEISHMRQKFTPENDFDILMGEALFFATFPVFNQHEI